MNPNAQAAFPKTRFRRARQSAQTRALIRENRVSVEDLIWPVFICDGEGVEQPVSSMPGVVRRSVDKLVTPRKKRPIWAFPRSVYSPTPILQENQRLCRGMEPKQPVQHGNPRNQSGGSRYRDHDRCRAGPL